MRIPFYLSTGLSVCAIALLAADGGSLNGPVSGSIFDAQSRSVRIVPGVPGAAYVGHSIASDVDAGCMSPDGSSVAVVKGSALLLLRSGADGWTARTIASGLQSSMTLTWSTGSKSFASAEASGLVRLWNIDGELLSGEVLPAAAVALSAAGNSVIAAVRGEVSGGVYLISGNEVRRLVSAPDVSSIALSGQDLFYADRSRNELWALRGYASAGNPVLVGKVEDPIAVMVDAARRMLLAVSKSGRKVAGFRLSSFEPAFELGLEFEPSSGDALGASAWVLNTGQAGPLQVLASGETPAVYFVPQEAVN